MLIQALQYLKRGWSVVPACWPVKGLCGCGWGHTDNGIGKSPLISWTEYQTRLPTETEVRGWWTRWPLANIAGITGAASGMVVVDVEHDGIPESSRLGLTSPLKARTGKGFHLVYKHPGGDLRNKTAYRQIRGFDFRGDGGYVLLSPSLHRTGRRYTWITDGSPAPFPKSLFAQTSEVGSRSLVSAKPQNWLSEALNGLGDGNRHDTFLRIGGRLHRDGWDTGSILGLLGPHGERVGFPKAELGTIVRSLEKYPIAAVPSLRGGATSVKLSASDLSSDWDRFKSAQAGVRNDEYATGFKKLDSLLGGGLQREELLLLAGWYGSGKSNFVLGLCRGLSTGGKRVLLLSTEMSKGQIWNRYIALCGGEEEAKKVSPIVADEFIPDIKAVKEAILEHKADVFIFDHIHNVSEDSQVVSQYMKDLKEMAKDLKIPGVVVAQFNKGADMRGDDGKRLPLRMSHIKGLGTLIQLPAQVLLLDVRDENEEGSEILGILDKNRHGEKGVINFALRKNPWRLIEVD